MNINTSAAYTGGLPERADKDASPPPEVAKAPSGEPRILPERKIMPEQKIIPTDTRVTSAVSAESVFAALIADDAAETADDPPETGAGESADGEPGGASAMLSREAVEAA